MQKTQEIKTSEAKDSCISSTGMKTENNVIEEIQLVQEKKQELLQWNPTLKHKWNDTHDCYGTNKASHR